MSSGQTTGVSVSPTRKRSHGALSELLADTCRTYHHAVDGLDEAVCDLEGINRTDLRCLDALERVDRMTAGHLAEACGVTTGAMTALLDRLERLGYVVRERDPVDRRKVYVAVTDLVRRRADELYGPLKAGHDRLARTFTADEIALIVRYLERGRELNLEVTRQLRDQARAKHPGVPLEHPPSDV